MKYIIRLVATLIVLAIPASLLAQQLGKGFGMEYAPASAATSTPAATPTPIAQQQLNDGATLALRMNDAASPCTSIADSAGTPHNATVHGGVTCGVTGGGVDGATAISFNGSTGYLTDSAPTYTLPFTIEFAAAYSTVNSGGLWDMNPGVGGARDEVCQVECSGSSSTYLGMNGGNCLGSFSTAFIFWDVVYQSTGRTIYLNGALTNSIGGATCTYAQGASIGIGSLNSGGADLFAGSLQDYAIYPSALSAATIKKHAGAYLGY